MDLYSASSLKQQSASRYVAQLGHIILIPSQSVCYFFLILSEQYQNPVWKIVETDKIDTPNTYTWRSLLACYRHFNEKWLVRLVLCAQVSPVSEMMRACKCISHASKMPTFTCNWMSSNLVEIWLLKAIIILMNARRYNQFYYNA